MRVLLMVDNANMAVRELYTEVLRAAFPGWGVSHMSGAPLSPDAILRGYQLVVYELGKADDPRRYKGALALWAEIKELGTIKMVTHIEGPYRDAIVAELDEQGVAVVEPPFEFDTVKAALERLAPPPRRAARAAAQDGGGAERRGFLGGLFRRARQDS